MAPQLLEAKPECKASSNLRIKVEGSSSGRSRHRAGARRLGRPWAPPVVSGTTSGGVCVLRARAPPGNATSGHNNPGTKIIPRRLLRGMLARGASLWSTAERGADREGVSRTCTRVAASAAARGRGIRRVWPWVMLWDALGVRARYVSAARHAAARRLTVAAGDPIGHGCARRGGEEGGARAVMR